MKLYNDSIIYINPELRESFIDRVLSRRWREEFNMIFDDEDLDLALSQNHNHFYEWFGAIQIYKDMKYLCLIEKYQFGRKHTKQRKIYESIVPAEVVNFIDSKQFKGHQAPDLLAYLPGTTNWFFCEVKGGSDFLHNSQEEAFKELEKVSGKEITIMKIKSDKRKRVSSISYQLK